MKMFLCPRVCLRLSDAGIILSGDAV